MAVKLRLKRMGSKQKPFYRIVAADSRSPRDGKFIEVVGTYQPIYEENNVNIDEEEIYIFFSFSEMIRLFFSVPIPTLMNDLLISSWTI